MAQFRGTLKGNRGPASRLGTKNSGLSGCANGWNIGLDFSVNHDAEKNQDSVSVGLSGGSNGYNDRLPKINVVADENGSYRIRLDNKIIAEKGEL